jgi:hypothetical protein
MDVKIFFMKTYIYDALMVIGLFYVCNLILWIFQNIISLYYHKESYKNPKELRYFLVLEENKKLKQKIQKLEEENSEIISSIINKLN